MFSPFFVLILLLLVLFLRDDERKKKKSTMSLKVVYIIGVSSCLSTQFPNHAPHNSPPFQADYLPLFIPSHLSLTLAQNNHPNLTSTSTTSLLGRIHRSGYKSRGAIIVKCLAQGHKCQGRDSNPHCCDSATTT